VPGADTELVRKWLPRRVGWLLTIVWAPVVFVSAVFTLSLFGAPTGLPVLALGVPPFWLGVLIVRRRSFPRSWRRLVPLVPTAVAIVAGVSAFVLGANDIDNAVDAVAALVGLGWLVAAAATAVTIAARPRT
jgi:hypothetical protein